MICRHCQSRYQHVPCEKCKNRPALCCLECHMELAHGVIGPPPKANPHGPSEGHHGERVYNGDATEDGCGNYSEYVRSRRDE
jgi:hypothetical protein